MQFIIRLIFITTLLTVCSCGNPSRSCHDRMVAAGELVNTRPDSAVTLLDSLDFDKLGKDKAYAHYLRGKANLNLHNYPVAMEAFMHAEKLSESAGNDSLLALSRRAMMDLSDSIYDVNEKARYAIKACEVYEKYDDYDNIYDVLSRITWPRGFEERPYKYAAGLKYYASLLNENDTARAYFYADTLTRRSELLYGNFEHIDKLNYSSWRFINGLKGFNAQELIDKIVNNDGWKEVITDKSSDISAQNAHLIATVLWEQGHINEAHEFINYYRLRYPEKIINQTLDTISRKWTSDISFRLVDPRKEEFRATFQDDVKSVVTKFQYEEVMMREQTIRHQRIMLITLTVMAIVIAAAIAMYLRMTAMRRRRREESSMQSVAEMRAALHDLEEQHLATLTRLCDTYYENYTDSKIKSKTARDTLKAIGEMAASAEFVGRLEKHLDDTTDRIMTRLREEMPDLKACDRQLFLYNALGLSIPTICLLLNERREVIYNRRIRLRAKIEEAATPHSEVFLDHLR